MQHGQANSKEKNLDDTDEGNQTGADALHTGENGCGEVTNDLVAKPECSPEGIAENENIDSTSVPDELRPLKKVKSSTEGSHTCEANNGTFA